MGKPAKSRRPEPVQPPAEEPAASPAPAPEASSRARAHATGEAAAVWVELDKLKPWDRNPRLNDGKPVEAVVESIRRFGFGSPILARLSDGEVIAGHTRLKAAQALGLAKVPVRYLDLDPAEARLLALADNRIGEFAEWDQPMLADILAGYSPEDAGLAGWDADALTELANATGASAGDVEEDEAPPVPANPVTQPGDVWTLGRHRLVCGDCRDAATVLRLLGEQRVHVAFTSPPYAAQREYDKSSGFKPIHPDEYVAWFDAVQENVRAALAPDGSWFVNIKEHSEGLALSLYVHDLVIAHARSWGWVFASEFCWERIGMPGRPARRFKNQFEPIYHFALGEWKFRPKAVSHPSDDCRSYSKANHWAHGLSDDTAGKSGSGWADIHSGMAYPGNRLPVFADKREGQHTAAFPVALPSFFLKAYSDEGDNVLDPFMGSGTTLIAAEKTERVAFGTELSPAYCDVIVERWQNLTGGKATRG